MTALDTPGGLMARNRILAALPAPDRDRLAPHLVHVDLALGQVLYRPGGPVEHVYFPLTGVASIVTELEHGQVVEVATVGDEGMVGLSVFLGAGPPTERCSVQIEGEALRVGSDRFRELAAVLDGALQGMLQRYAQAMFTQLARNAACNRSHHIRERCARWLLMSADRTHSAEFPLTQEFLAQMLAVRRASVSEVAAALAEDGCISYRRGVITITDRARLEANACECYRVIRDTFAAAYPPVRERPEAG
ncbi:Crp/Fnr family transcriptional regulator [Saccharothrix sp. BKS2]|uniref:Crp/Fnr family transcriptional regulator n=1 Tax=Saccharothrix sp. BKS2 TaxID=3064400 RepID=UPI0039EAFDB0